MFISTTLLASALASTALAFLEIRSLSPANLNLQKQLIWSNVNETRLTDTVGPLPANAYYIHHPVKNVSIMWDLSMRKDFENLPPHSQATIASVYKPEIYEDVVDLLERNGVVPDSISTVIFSHAHNDHTGDVSKFAHAELIYGRGTQAEVRPAYPLNNASDYDESIFPAGRTRELTDSDFSGPAIGPWNASFDFFGDGSFLVVDAPGHMSGHQIAVAKGVDGWVLLGGDSCHHETGLYGWPVGGVMGYGMHENETLARSNMERIAEFLKETPGVKRAFAHVYWFEDWTLF